MCLSAGQPEEKYQLEQEITVRLPRDLMACTVEKIIVKKKLENNLVLYLRELGMPEGLHCEGAALHSLLGLLLWDQIYQVSGFQSGNVKQFIYLGLLS